MATRATIKIEGTSIAKVYKHWDGYPSGMLPWLEKFNKQFAEKRGNDPDYKLAQLLRSSALLQDEFDLDKSTETGYGIIPYHSKCGEEFEYTLKADGTVTYTAL